MARLPRLTAPGLPHHIIQRGNNRQPIFLDEVDCVRFLKDLADLAAVHALAIHAYVLMPNHVHLLATPAENDTLARFMQALGRRYVRWFNTRHRRTGTLWEGRYRSTVVESDRYLLACMRYIELNPVRAGLVDDPSAYRWSSHKHQLGLRSDPLISEHAVYWSLGNTPFERQLAYRRLFDQGTQAEEIEAIRTATQRGWVLGERGFIEEIAAKAGRRASPVRPGRPRKMPI
jgi:putative transposase